MSDGLIVSSNVSIGRAGEQLLLPCVHMGCMTADMCSVYATNLVENIDSRVRHSAHKGGACGKQFLVCLAHRGGTGRRFITGLFTGSPAISKSLNEPHCTPRRRCQVQDTGIFPYRGIRDNTANLTERMNDRLVDAMLQCNEDPYWVEVVAIETPVILYSLIFVALA